jgi:hypothetical protein
MTCKGTQSSRQRIGLRHTNAGNVAIVRRSWDASVPGMLRLPSGRLVRGRGLRQPPPDGPYSEFGGGRGRTDGAG